MFTLMIAALMMWGIKDIVKVKQDEGPEALLRSAISTGNTPQNGRP